MAIRSTEVEKYMGRTWLEVSLDVAKANQDILRNCLREDVKLACVIKADAYGLGASVLANAFAKSGADMFIVASLDEGLELRQSGILNDILLLSDHEDLRLEEGLMADLSFTVSNLSRAQLINQIAGKLGLRAKVHINIDTGMGRLGFLWKDDNLLSDIRQISEFEHISIEGVYTHFATADAYNVSGDWKAYANLQLERFIKLKNDLSDNLHIPVFHAANSASIMTNSASHFDLVRAGLALYGIKSENAEDLGLKLCFSLHSRIALVKTLAAGESCSYGRTYLAKEERKIAVLPIGYADGYKRVLGNKAEVIVSGLRVPVIGTITMDQLMIDVSNIPDVKIGDEVILLGQSGEAEITIEELANWANTIPYEIMTSFSTRIRRIYEEKGERFLLLE